MIVLYLISTTLKLIGQARYFEGDIRDYNKVNHACKDIDVIFHNVAQVPIAKNKHLLKA